MWYKSVALGYRRSLKNYCLWYKVVVNLPEIITYEFQLPWSYKECRYGLISADFFSMWMMGGLLAPQKHVVVKNL